MTIQLDGDARGHHDAHARPRLRAGRRLLLHRGSARRRAGRAASATAPTARRVDTDFNVVTVETGGLAPAPTPRLGNDVVELRLVRQRAARRARRPPRRRCRRRRRSTVDVLARVPGRGARPAGRCSRRPAPCTPRPRSTPTARCSWRARTSAATTPSTRWSARCCSTARLPGAPDLGLFVSGRASFEMVQKAWAAGFGTLVAVSAPTALAVARGPPRRAARSSGFVRGDRFNVYAPERLRWRPDGQLPGSLDAMRIGIGLGVLHLFCKPTPIGSTAEAVDGRREGGRGRRRARSSPVAMLGHKADLAVMALAPDWRRCARCRRHCSDAGLDVVDSYVSHHRGQRVRQGHARADAPRAAVPAAAARGQAGVLLLPDEQAPRRRTPTGTPRRTTSATTMMHEHGTSGRTFAGRVVQLITGSTGLDDYEWGVTLFAVHPDDVKDVVYTMRFDKALGAVRRVRPLLRRLPRLRRRTSSEPVHGDERWRPRELVVALLVEAEHVEPGLGWGRPRLPISVSPDGPS